MKLQSLLFILLFSISLSVLSQNKNEHNPYLFETFQDGIVKYKDGRNFAVPLNFDFSIGKYVFIDNADGLEKEFTSPDAIALMQIESRIFLYSSGKATEVIQNEPRFYVLYIGLKRKAPSKTSYGGTTQTASVDTYKGLTGKGIISGKQANERILVNVNKSYEVQVGSKYRNFYNKRSFLKIFPKNKRAALESYITSQSIDFNSVSQVHNLYQYSISH